MYGENACLQKVWNAFICSTPANLQIQKDINMIHTNLNVLQLGMCYYKIFELY